MYKRQVLQTRERIGAVLEELTPQVRGERGRSHLAQVIEQRNAFVQLQQAFIDAQRAGDRAAAVKLLEEKLNAQQNAYIQAVSDFRDFIMELIDAGAKASEETSRQATLFVLALLACRLPGPLARPSQRRACCQPCGRPPGALRSAACAPPAFAPTGWQPRRGAGLRCPA